MKKLLTILLLVGLCSCGDADESATLMQPGMYSSLFHVTEAWNSADIGGHSASISIFNLDDEWTFWAGMTRFEAKIKDGRLIATRETASPKTDIEGACVWTMVDTIVLSSLGSTSMDKIEGWEYIDLDITNCNIEDGAHRLEAYILGVNTDIF